MENEACTWNSACLCFLNWVLVLEENEENMAHRRYVVLFYLQHRFDFLFNKFCISIKTM